MTKVTGFPAEYLKKPSGFSLFRFLGFQKFSYHFPKQPLNHKDGLEMIRILI